MSDPFSGLAGRYLASGETLRGIVRHTLVARQLGEHLARPPARALDVGGGAGHQAMPLARRGYEVTILDPSRTMLREAGKNLASEEHDVRRRVRLVEGLATLFEENGIGVVRWYGVRVFTDHLGDRPPDSNLPDVLELEWEAGQREPYRSIARLIHVVGRKRPG